MNSFTFFYLIIFQPLYTISSGEDGDTNQGHRADEARGYGAAEAGRDLDQVTGGEMLVGDFGGSDRMVRVG